ncbi:alpha-amylase family protein [Chitinasiproducens palmae]|uniref:hypothetical protein n=1 Tax=Chitinasiproducens palmae TaxID=1770053 RepID=UPI001F16036E|nr:hypothetical protein [Chitinasiproducens palmae]
MCAEGVVWQPDADHLKPVGDWQKLGIKRLLVQWTVVDNIALIDGTKLSTLGAMPDWERIAREPWAHETVLGLAGRFNEPQARAQAGALAALSLSLPRPTPALRIGGYYFPVEADPTWTDVAAFGRILAGLPRPLWISVYDNSNIGPQALAAWVNKWLPADIGVYFQDGVGLYTRSPDVALQYADALIATRGKARVRIIAEAFRPRFGGGVRSATAAELAEQLRSYAGRSVWLFDGPHYVNADLIRELVALGAGQGCR